MKESWATVGDGIESHKVTCGTSDGGMVVFDPNFLQSGYSRKLYVLSGRTGRPWRTEAHFHASPQICSLIDGEATLAYEDRNGRIVTLQIERARYYRIGPNVPHQFEVKGRAVLESFVPASALVSWLATGRRRAKEILNPDLFTRLDVQAAPATYPADCDAERR